MKFRRKLYSRGGSTETTIPKPLLFQTEDNKKYDAVFTYDKKSNKWYIEIEEHGA